MLAVLLLESFICCARSCRFFYRNVQLASGLIAVLTS